MEQLIGSLLIGALLTLQAPDSKPKTVWDGVYTEAQAERGKTVYESHCAMCHGNDLSGINAQALKGNSFLEKWREDTVNSLFTRIKTSMPARAPGTLSDQMYVDVVGYLLEANAYPVGSEELRTDDLEIQGISKDGPAEVPEFALVQMVGCLTRGADKSWNLTSATEPARTRDPGQPSAEDLKAVAGRSLGSDTYKLLYVDSFRSGFSPEAHEGQKVEAKGFLIRKPEFRLSVTWVETISPNCKD
jgi:mono/diheme cytochrome c family protein